MRCWQSASPQVTMLLSNNWCTAGRPGAGGRSWCRGAGAAARAADLPPPQRQVWMLAELDGLSCLEISELVGAGEQAVRGRLFRARAALVDALRAWR
ncbi:RNA polymerase sigma factor [Saccharopolyspora sp. NPDC002376]